MNNSKEIKNTLLRESYYEIDHPSGLKIFVMPKPDYNSAYAIFGTRYGSIDTRFKRSDETEFTEVPEGIAHFLEHKLFESEDGDAFSRYAETGAYANAYTSFDKTCYLFSCSANFRESMTILLDFVQSPYFTEKTVQKEQGIIGQEIRMYDDEAGWRVFFGLLCAMYHNHPVRIDVAGTVESIAKIDAELLYRCYNTFYNLHNMALAVTGNIRTEDVLALADQMLKSAPPLSIERNFPEEPSGVVTEFVSQTLSVAAPIFALGFKEDCPVPEKTLKEKLETEVLLELLAGDTSPLYERLFNEKLINTTFDAEYFTGYGYAAVLFQGESADPEKTAAEIRNEIARLKTQGIPDADFERALKALYGRSIMEYNCVDVLANSLIAGHFTGCGLFDDIEIYRNMKKSDVERRLAEQMDTGRGALSVVVGKAETEK